MKIVKYKKNSNGKYSVYLEDDSKITLYEETILHFNLLLTKNIENIDEINEYNNIYDVYYTGVNSLKSRFKSTSDLRKLLINKKYDIDIIDSTIDKLIKQGYLNDRSYSKSYINNQIVTTNRGPLRIKNDLINKGVNVDIIDEELIVYTDKMQNERINKLIEKMIKANHTRGGNILKNKIFNDLKILGYDSECINKVIVNYSFNSSSDIYKKEYNKLYNRLSRKYEGKELEYKIKEKLYLKGLYEENN